ncbi:MAG: hypothetical protein HKO66_09370 [Saprospiraceae bacterium]|nr:hypothetical protein [Bacteroidia bacterium]NNE14551.1 hypothetical protein [Saprospiraceae bacterium]NNL92427.1 hypothetical protein [Saprospiraceae bacterium]
MLNRKVIAQNITNLTDARYFAAWGVDYLGFNMMPDSEYTLPLDKIKEIKEWVEGPKCLIETNALDFNEVADGHILSNIYSSIPLSKEAFYRINLEEIKKGLPSGKYILDLESENQLDVLAKIDSTLTQGIELYLNIADIPVSLFPKFLDFNLVIQGGDEEKVGVKSYDELDELYELLI